MRGAPVHWLVSLLLTFEQPGGRFLQPRVVFCNLHRERSAIWDRTTCVRTALLTNYEPEQHNFAKWQGEPEALRPYPPCSGWPTATKRLAEAREQEQEVHENLDT